MREDTQGRKDAPHRPSLRPTLLCVRAGNPSTTALQSQGLTSRGAQHGSYPLVPNRTIIRMTLTYDKVKHVMRNKAQTLVYSLGNVRDVLSNNPVQGYR